jgi:hypothetical protein
MARLEGDEWNLALTLGNLGATLVKRGAKSADAVLSESLARYRRIGEPEGIAHVLQLLARTSMQHRAYEKAREALGQALTLARRLDHLSMTADLLADLGHRSLLREDYPQ